MAASVDLLSVLSCVSSSVGQKHNVVGTCTILVWDIYSGQLSRILRPENAGHDMQLAAGMLHEQEVRTSCFDRVQCAACAVMYVCGNYG